MDLEAFAGEFCAGGIERLLFTAGDGDPGAGSMLLQAILAAVAGSVFALKQYWSRVASLLKRKPRRDQTDDIAG